MTKDPVKLTPEQLISSTALTRDVAKYLNMAKDKPLFIARKNEIEVVMLGIEEYREPQIRLDEEEKKIIDLIRQHKLDYVDVGHLLLRGADRVVEYLNIEIELGKSSPSLQRDLDKYTKLLEALEKG